MTSANQSLLTALSAGSEDDESSDDGFDQGELDAALTARRAGNRRLKKTAAQAKTRKGTTDKSRKELARARRNDNSFLRAPRPLLMVRALDWERSLVAERSRKEDRPKKQLAQVEDEEEEDDHEGADAATTVSSRREGVLLMAEYCESRPWGARQRISGPRSPRSGCLPRCTLFNLQGRCSTDTCLFTYEFSPTDKQRYDDDDNDDGDGENRYSWTLRSFVPHDELCGRLLPRQEGIITNAKVRRAGNSAYTTQQLARVVASANTDAMSEISLKECKMALQPFLRAEPSKMTKKLVRKAAMLLIRGTPSENFAKLDTLKIEAEKAGYRFTILEVDADEMNRIVDKKAKNDHAILMKKTPKGERTAFNASAVKSRRAQPGEVFFKGLTVVMPTTKKMLQAGKLMPVFSCDFAHAKGIFSC
jgi:hypothetical protein